MERRVATPTARRARAHPPSFSSSLLDSIYRSIDESDHRATPDPFPTPPLTPKPVTRLQPPINTLRSTAAPRRDSAVARPRFRCPDSTSSSSDGSTYNGFSSDSPPSLRSVRTAPTSVRLDRSRFDPPPSSKPSSARSQLEEPKKTKPPASPGARLASFLNSIIATAAKPKKTRSSGAAAAAPAHPSALGGGKRKVRFGTVSVIAGEERGRSRDAAAREGRRWAAEAMRGFEVEEEDDVASDASSDLFELEDLAVSGDDGGELPVYASSNLKKDRSVAYRSAHL